MDMEKNVFQIDNLNEQAQRYQYHRNFCPEASQNDRQNQEINYKNICPNIPSRSTQESIEKFDKYRQLKRYRPIQKTDFWQRCNYHHKHKQKSEQKT